MHERGENISLGMEGTEMEPIKTLLGAGASKFYEEAGYSVQTWAAGQRGLVSYGGDEIYVLRRGSRKWEVRDTDGDSFWFGSQWELLAWFGDRL